MAEEQEPNTGAAEQEPNTNPSREPNTSPSQEPNTGAAPESGEEGDEPPKKDGIVMEF